MKYLNIGGPIALASLGAVLFFAVNVETSGFNLSTIGLILMGAAAVWLVAGIIAAASSSSRTKSAPWLNGNVRLL